MQRRLLSGLCRRAGRQVALVALALLATTACATSTHTVKARPRPTVTVVSTGAATPMPKPTLTPTVTSTPTPTAMAPSAWPPVAAAVRAAIAGRGAVVDVAVEDLTTGVTAHVGDGTPVRTASLIKLLILRALAAHGPLSDKQRRMAAVMIERSDNVVATTLWRAAGGDAALAAAVAAAGMTHTTRVPVRLLPWDGWVTTATDQLRLLRLVVTGSDAGSHLLRSLMGQVSAEQAWGAGSVPGSSHAILKNGWLPVDSGWVVNTDGCMRLAGNAVCISVTSSGSPTMDAGVRTVNAAARAAVTATTAKRPATLPASTPSL